MGVWARATGFAAAVARVDVDRGRPLSGARRAGVVAASVAVGWWAAGPDAAAGAGTAAFLVGFVDRQQPPFPLLRAMGATALILAVTTALVALMSPWPLLILALLGLIAFAEGVAIVVGSSAPMAMHFAGITAATALVAPHSPDQALSAAVVVLAAGAAQTLLSYGYAVWSPRIREVVQVADQLDLLASAMDAAADIDGGDAGSRAGSRAVAALTTCGRGLSGLQSALAAGDLDPGERERLLDVVAAADRVRAEAKADAVGLTGGAHGPGVGAPADRGDLRDRAGVARGCAQLLRGHGTSRRGVGLDPVAGLSPADPATAGLLAAAVAVVSTGHRRRRWGRDDGRIWPRLAAAVVPGTTTFRLGARLAVGVMAAMAIGWVAGLVHASWVAGAVLGVLRPDSPDALARVVLRAVGVTIGSGLVVAVAVASGQERAALFAAMTVAAFLSYGIGPLNHGLFVAGVTATVLLVITVTGQDPVAMAAARWVDTLIGCVVAAVVALVLPVWQTQRLPAAVAALVTATADWWDGIADACRRGPGERDAVRLRRLGARARDAVGDVLALQRMAAVEPRSGVDVPELVAVVNHARDIALDALIVERQLTPGQGPDPRAAVLADDVVSGLRTLAATIDRSGGRRIPAATERPAPDRPDGGDDLTAVVGHARAVTRYVLRAHVARVRGPEDPGPA